MMVRLQHIDIDFDIDIDVDDDQLDRVTWLSPSMVVMVMMMMILMMRIDWTGSHGCHQIW